MSHRASALKCAAALLAALALAGCVNTSQQNADLASLARTALIGQQRSQILECAGKPEHAETKGDIETLRYSSSSGESTIMLGAGSTLISNVQHSCTVTLLLRRGFVEDVQYAGRTGATLTPDEECAAVVRKCTRLR